MRKATDEAIAQTTNGAEQLRRWSWVSLALGIAACLLAWQLKDAIRFATLLAWGMAAHVAISVAVAWALRSAAAQRDEAARQAKQLSRQARDSEQHLHTVLAHTSDGVVTLSPEGWILSANRAMRHVFGYAEADLMRMHLRQLMPAPTAEVPASSSTLLEKLLEMQGLKLDGISRRTLGRRHNGSIFPMAATIVASDASGLRHCVCVLKDLGAEHAAERDIIEAQRQLNEVDEMRRIIVHHAPYAILELNRLGTIQAINPAGETLLGCPAHDLVGQATTQHFFDPLQVIEQAHMLALRLNQPAQELNVLEHLAAQSPGVPSEWRLIRPDGQTLVAELSVTTLIDEGGALTGYLLMAQDVTLRREAENQVQHMAMHDALTALPNRNMLQEQLKSTLRLAERHGHVMALMLMDLDRFKKINDTLGHQVGDMVLTEVARRLKAAMRTSDIVARVGGDEFAILLPRMAQVSDGDTVAKKIIDVLAQPLQVGDHELRITTSIGLVTYPAHGGDAVTLMRHADLAMYQAKSCGRNRLQVYRDDMESPTAEMLVFESDLYKAMERDELRLHFQPQFECATGQIVGAEALLRWERDGKLVSPADFIPLAEETGLIVSMGDWVLRRACAKTQHWRQQSGWPMRVAVNLSAVQLDQHDIVARVAQALHDTGLPAQALELEITESVIVRESLRAAKVLTQLRSLGVGISIDDFGVGYSSFGYLRELPVDRLKMDRSFLNAVPESAGDSRLAAALIAMAHRLEVGIVAEGVENAAQRDFLRDHGCDEAQGYFLSRPLQEDAFEALLLAHSSSRTWHAPQTLEACTASA